MNTTDNRCTVCLQDGHKAHNCPQAKYLPRMALAIALLACSTVHAQGMAPDYLNLGGPSYHFDSDLKRASGFNERNAGIGLTWAGRDVPALGDADVSAGIYHNSERRTTAYLAAHKLPLSILGARAGLTVGLATGYQMAAVVPIVAPTACWRYVCAMVIPPIKNQVTGALSLQFRIPL